MSRAHVEIAHLIRRLGRVLDDIDPAAPTTTTSSNSAACSTASTHLQLHFAQEDEGYLSLAEEADVLTT